MDPHRSTAHAPVMRPALAAALSDRYDIVREVGRGGMASVYLAADRKHDRNVAIKVMHAELTETIGADRFLREIRTVARLQHPHILPLYDSGEADGTLYFVMPFVEGESLRDRLERDGSCTIDETVRLTRQLADALDYAHARGIVHRDVKPENIMMSGVQGFLADFGVARANESQAPARTSLTSVGVTLGTPAYMSPEQAVADATIDGRSDIYSLGCVCFEMLSGAPPFDGPSAMAIIRHHIMTPPSPPVSEHGPLPDGICAAILRALAKEPLERYASAGDLAAELERGAVLARQPSVADLRLRVVERRHEARERILVLDFANLAGAADADWLATGIAESVGADLNQIAGVKVVSEDATARRRTAEDLRPRALDAETAIGLGRRATAHWVVWGAFQKLGPRIRITMHCANVDSAVVVHEENLDAVIDDIFTLQDRIVTSISDALGIRLSTSEVAKIHQPATTNLTAYEHYARGYRAYLQFGKESVLVAAEHFSAAIALDPDYALAHAMLGVVHGPRYIATGSPEVLSEGIRLLERALALDPTIGEAHAWLAYMRFRSGRFDEAVATARRAVELDPAGYLGWYMLGCGHLSHGVTTHRPSEFARGVAPLLRCIAINPTYHPAHMVLGSIYICRGAYAHATTLIDRAVELETSTNTFTFVGALVQRAIIHIGAGELERAAPLLDRAIERYAGADAVYAEAMSAYGYFARGCLAERSGDVEAARGDFERGARIADLNPHRIGIGAHWVKARLGLARTFWRLGRRAEACRTLDEAQDMFHRRPRFVWTWFIGVVDADVLYELAATLATMERQSDAAATLTKAADAGWADLNWLRHDPAFESLRDAADIRRICAAAAARVSLPPPVGTGGLG